MLEESQTKKQKKQNSVQNDSDSSSDLEVEPPLPPPPPPPRPLETPAQQLHFERNKSNGNNELDNIKKEIGNMKDRITEEISIKDSTFPTKKPKLHNTFTLHQIF